MYYNVFGEKVSRRRYKEMCEAAKNRRELIAAGLTSRRSLLKMGLLGAGGMLVAKSGLSARAQTTQTVLGRQVKTDKPPSGPNTNSPGTNQSCVPGNQVASPMTTPFTQPLTIMPVAKTVSTLTPKPTLAPNFSAGEVRAAPFQAPQIDMTRFPVVPGTLYKFTQESFTHTFAPGLTSTVWGFNDQTHGPMSPGPTYQAFYGKPQLTRNVNNLPSVTQMNNTGFGMPSVSTHLHNGHTPSESDGNPCDFYPANFFCDQYYPNVLAGFTNLPFEPNGDIRESLSTLWYHDHRVDFTSQNVYKGLAGFYLLFNQFDTGNEDTGFHLPSFPQFDIPLMFQDKVFDSDGELVFDLFNLDGILGDKFIVNGVVQPFLEVCPRRYRFRLLDAGPSRFYEFFLTGNADLTSTGNPTTNPFHLIATDGNLIPNPVQVTSVRIGVAERVDIIIDFSKFTPGSNLYLENRLLQINGQGPVGVNSQLFGQGDINSATECQLVLDNPPQPAALIRKAGKGDKILQFRVTGPVVADNSMDPALAEVAFNSTGAVTFYQLPPTTGTPRVVRTFKFDRLNGQWSINGQFMDCGYGNGGTGGESTETFRFTVQQNSIEHWILTNLTGDWTHPVHIHLEEHQILTRNRKAPTVPADIGRKDVTQLHPNERVELFFRFRDWVGKYPIHCHNVIHEDHAMMALWQVQPNGDTVLVP
ncbi:MAG TPA: multicopper oxidase domain-containing protein [Candidatus Angelobacter sp.]